MPGWIAVAAWVAAGAAASAGAAPACRSASGPSTAPLVELYTSEGCSSCPPADRWLASTFGASPRPATAPDSGSVVAIALHVDYWDRQGWVDRFATPAYTQRQYAAMRANRQSFVYTPQVLLQGRDLPAWRDPAAWAAISAAAARPARAKLALEAEPEGSRVTVRAAARVDDRVLRQDARLFVAYVDSGLHSEVGAGENRGLRLTHDHVVRALTAAGGLGADGSAHAQVVFARPAEAGTAATIVAFVQRDSSGEVLQALALPLADCASR